MRVVVVGVARQLARLEEGRACGQLPAAAVGCQPAVVLPWECNVVERRGREVAAARSSVSLLLRRVAMRVVDVLRGDGRGGAGHDGVYDLAVAFQRFHVQTGVLVCVEGSAVQRAPTIASASAPASARASAVGAVAVRIVAVRRVVRMRAVTMRSMTVRVMRVRVMRVRPMTVRSMTVRSMTVRVMRMRVMRVRRMTVRIMRMRVMRVRRMTVRIVRMRIVRVRVVRMRIVRVRVVRVRVVRVTVPLRESTRGQCQ